MSDQREVKVGDKVTCLKGTKDGTGVVTYKDALGVMVDFPDQKYPLSMMVISGSYFIPWKDVIRVED